jgi:hypothetical protein
MSQLEKEMDSDTPSVKRRNSSHRSIAASELDTVRSQRSSTTIFSYCYNNLAASEIHLHAELPKDIEDAVNDIINSKLQSSAELILISYSNSLQIVVETML